MLVKVVFPHSVIDTGSGFFNVEAVVSKHELVPMCEIKSLEFVGGFNGPRANLGKKLFLSIAGAEITHIIELVYQKVNAGEWTAV